MSFLNKIKETKIVAIYKKASEWYNAHREENASTEVNKNMNSKKKERPRVIVITDISSMQSGILEPDDTQSMVRFLLYSNEVDIEGLIACAYGNHGTRPEYLQKVVDAYEKDWDNLRKHDERYHSPERLRSCIVVGNNRTGMDQLGRGNDTEASNWIISAADRDDPRPLWILLWGGALDLAQAVWKVANERTLKEAKAFRGKLRVYSIGDQYDDTGKWMKKNFSDLFYITNYASFRGMYRFGDETLTDSKWVQEHIKNGSALGNLYPDYKGGDPWGIVNGIKEGDTPSVLYVISPKEQDLEDPTKPSWGGQFFRVGENQYQDVPQNWVVSNHTDEIKTYAETIAKWRAEYQADFAKRLQWCVK